MEHRRVWAEIDLDALSGNLSRIRAVAGPEKGVIAIVKANAYGHGAVPVGWHLAAQGVDALGVGDSQEAIELREAGISIPILILGAVVRGELADVVANDIAVTIHSAERVRLLEREARRAGRAVSVHLKVDTGLGRLGCARYRAVEIARSILASEHLRFEGLCTHLSSVGPEDAGFTEVQLGRFEEVTRELLDAGVAVPRRHVCASAGILSRVGPHFEMVRPGLALYGIPPSPELGAELTPALSLRTTVIFLKDFAPGTPIGYNREHTTHKRTRIATLPVGYNDGYRYGLGGRADVLVRGRRARVVGRISMDYLTVDVGHVPGVQVGDEVVLIGSMGSERITVGELAKRAGTIPYEILTGLGKRVVRVYRGGAGGRERGFGIVRRPEVPETGSRADPGVRDSI
jgi:alanine racemase